MKPGYSIFLIFIALVACSSRSKVSTLTETPPPSESVSDPSQTPPPFEYVSEMPPGEFLFLFLHDDDYTCLDGLCACPVSETPPPSFEFIDEILYLNPYLFEEIPEDWVALRKDRQAIALYGFSGSQHAEFRLFSSFPLETHEGNFVIHGVNPQGEIQVQSNDEYRVIPVGSNASSEEPEQEDEGCRVLHKYSLTNHGLIKDENVRFKREW